MGWERKKIFKYVVTGSGGLFTVFSHCSCERTAIRRAGYRGPLHKVVKTILIITFALLPSGSSKPESTLFPVDPWVHEEGITFSQKLARIIKTHNRTDND